LKLTELKTQLEIQKGAVRSLVEQLRNSKRIQQEDGNHQKGGFKRLIIQVINSLQAEIEQMAPGNDSKEVLKVVQHLQDLSAKLERKIQFIK